MAQDKFTRLIRVDKNGTKIFEDWRCSRCGGAGGSDKWALTGWTCFECGGSGLRNKPVIFKEYTPEHQAKLDAQRAKRQALKQAKWEAEQREKAQELNAKFFSKEGFDFQGNIWVILGDTYSIKDELKEAGCKFDYSLGWHCDHALAVSALFGKTFATLKLTASQICNQNEFGVFHSWKNEELSQLISEAQRAHEEKTAPKGSEYIGNIGDKIEMPVTFWKMSTYKVQAFGGYYNRDEPAMETKYIYSFIDASGNCLIWNTTSFHQLSDDDKLILKGTIKRHSEYKGIKQTELQRCKITKEVTT